MRELVDELRRRFKECRRGAPLESWRALQLEILQVVKRLRKPTTEREHATLVPSSNAEISAALWMMLGESFWLERDLPRLASMVEDVIVEIDSLCLALEQREPSCSS